MKEINNLKVFQLEKLYEANEKMVDKKYKLKRLIKVINRGIKEKHWSNFNESISELNSLSREIAIISEKTSVFYEDNIVYKMNEERNRLAEIVVVYTEDFSDKRLSTVQKLIDLSFKCINDQKEVLEKFLEKHDFYQH